MSAPAYFIFHAVITQPEGMGPYLAHVGETIAAAGGKNIVMSDQVIAYEGDAPKGIMVVLQFPSLDAAKGWYSSPAYQAIIGHRHASATTTAYLVEGAPV